MSSPTSSLYTAAAVAELDLAAVAAGTPSFTLMRRAGDALLQCLLKNYPAANNILVLCGAGNNAGDGYVLARLAKQLRLEVTVVSLVDTEKLQGDAAIACTQWQELGEVSQLDDLDIDCFDIIVDALLGIGLDRDVEAEWKHCIETVNAADTAVIAADIPSGLDADSGRIRGVAIQAQHTVTFIALKQGLYTADGRQQCGQIHFYDLEVAYSIYSGQSATARLLYAEDVMLPARPHNTHKSSFGQVLIVGGDTGMAGAVALAARAALVAGAGMVKVVTRPEHVGIVTTLCPEAMVYASENGDLPAMDWSTVSHVLIGCGLGQESWSHRLLHHVRQMTQPVIYDADAINLLARGYDVMRNAAVLTPHPGEAARLMGVSSGDIQHQRFDAARQLAATYECTIVLKGSGTIISDPAGMSVCQAGSAAMASAGMGDVLAGIIAGFMAQGLSQTDAACAAVYYHAHAAELLARGQTRGVLASEICTLLPQVMHESENPSR